MKKIKITQATKQDNSYRIYLGNGTAFKFKNQKEANRFLAITNEFLDKQLFELRKIFIEVWNNYQKNWYYFSHDKKTMDSTRFMSDKLCSSNLLSIQNKFDIIIERARYTNGNYLTFTGIEFINYSLKETIKLLNILNQKRSSTVDLYDYSLLINRINTIESRINSYGQQEAISLFKPPLHISNSVVYIPKLSIVA